MQSNPSWRACLPARMPRTLCQVLMLGAVGAAALVARAPAAAMDIATYEQQRKLPAGSPVQARLRVYLLGIGEGIRHANAALTARGDPPLFCPPDDTPLSVDQYLDLIDSVLPSARQDPQARELPVERLLLRALQGRLGCGPVSLRPERDNGPGGVPGRP